MKKLFLIVALLLAAAPASAQVIVKCRTSGGSLVDCSTPLNNGYVNWASPQSIGTVSAPAAIHATTFYGSAAGLTNVPASSVAGSLSGVTINCSSNTCSNIANSALTNSSITLTCTGLSGCGAVALGATLPIAVSYGSSANTATQGNDARLPPTPTAANKLLYDTGSAYAETAACGTAGTMLIGGSPPSCSDSGSLATQLTTPKVTSTGQLAINAAAANNVTLNVNNAPVVTVGSAGVTLAQPLAMSNQTISGLPAATASPGGQALAWPWITSTASFNTLSSGFTITAANGTYAGTGLTYTFSGAGTYWCVGTVRSSVAVSAGAGANISLKLRNTTTSTDLTNSIRIGAYASTVGAAYIATTPMAEVVTVTGADTIEVYAASNTGTTYTARSVDSDTAGYSKLGCMKIAP